jgi:hypothetical protein
MQERSEVGEILSPHPTPSRANVPDRQIGSQSIGAVDQLEQYVFPRMHMRLAAASPNVILGTVLILRAITCARCINRFDVSANSIAFRFGTMKSRHNGKCR